MKWSDEYKVHYYYTDYNNVLKPGYIARYMQETACNALKNWGPTPKYLKENDMGFILAKISFRYYEEIFEDDIIKVETWANPPKSLIFTRNYRIYKDGKTAVEAVSSWVLMDIKEKNILRTENFDEKFMAYDDEKLTFEVQRRLKMPEEMNLCEEYKVRYADIDTNFHMNNVAYIDLICDNLYENKDIISPELKKRIVSLDLNYNGEARFAQTIKINKGMMFCIDAEEYYMCAKIKDGDSDSNNGERNCFDAKIILTRG